MKIQNNLIQENEATLKRVINDLQSNILKHHGRRYAYHLFFAISNVALFIKQIKLLKLKTAAQQIEDSEAKKKDKNFDGGSIVTISFSAKGLQKLKAPIPKDEAFKAGMQSRRDLYDDIKVWDEALKKELHVLIIIADSSDEIAHNNSEEIINLLMGGAKHIVTEKGTVLKNKNGIGIEHFGYADGISQPLYLEDEINGLKDPKYWNDAASVNQLLVKEGDKIIGSYFVFRKLEQDVFGFKTAEERKPAQLIYESQKHLCPVLDVNGYEFEELPGAMMVGRFEDGTETINYSLPKNIEEESKITNDFDYDKADGSKCPFHAHIRLTNPRGDLGANHIEAKKIRITRRGIPYNYTDRTEENLETNFPRKNVGLLFMCYQASIAQQFEAIQIKFANKGKIGNQTRGIDGIIGQGKNSAPQYSPEIYGNKAKNNITNFSGFVTTKGGEYFFTPLISFIKNLK